MMRNISECPRLIEVALPIREISAESVRDKNINTAHISNLHIWWARRPLPASRAVIFSSLVPDPENHLCPKEFIFTVKRLLKTEIPDELKAYSRGRKTFVDNDPYRPIEGISDTLRNRLLTFIGKWSPEAIAFELGKSDIKCSPKFLLDDRSLIKWETCDPENAQGIAVLKIAQELIQVAYNGKTPTVLDSFAGGGAIPLEIGRLGGHAISNDYNPVAHLIQQATCKLPQKYGHPGVRKKLIQELGLETEEDVKVENTLVYDFQYWANEILCSVKQKIKHLFPTGKDGKPILTYLWARTIPCSNPSCQAQIPLLRSLIIRSKSPKVALSLNIDHHNKRVSFGIVKGDEVNRTEGTKRARGPLICPFCDQPTSERDIRSAASAQLMGEQMICVVVQSKQGKDYRPVEEIDLTGFTRAQSIQVECPAELIPHDQWKIGQWLYGMNTWGELFNHRQLVVMQTFINCLHEALDTMEQTISDKEYRLALVLYLGLWLDRIAVFNNSFTRWQSTAEKGAPPFGGQAIPMMWDYPEVNSLAHSSGTASTQLKYMVNVINRLKINNIDYTEPSILFGTASSLSIKSGFADCVVTDPPYDDAIAYSDLSDFFYIWLKRSIGKFFPDIFSTPLTPKSDEATSLKHRHGGSLEQARAHYQILLKESFKEALRVTREPQLVTVMFAHQSSDAWTGLISALFQSGLSPTATWPIATERPKTALALGTASLETSVTVACRPRIAGSAISLKQVRSEINEVVHQSVKRFWSYGFRGADLIVACYGPAVGVFGKYEHVERTDGTRVEIPDLLEIAKGAARDAIAGSFRGDQISTLYYVWASLYGASEQSWDDARLVVQIGGYDTALDVDERDAIFVVDGSKCRLAVLKDRTDYITLIPHQNPTQIDALHSCMLLWKQEKRQNLVHYLIENDLFENDPFWKLAQALFEVLPRDLEDWKLINALLLERHVLTSEGKSANYTDIQTGLFTDNNN